ncbi:MAG: arsenate reductase (glutaredoxin) [Gammaproteobacteria bacterium]|jgi:arsenate reductase|nr:arsenate reductase (glutaredoxin) [Gammaproteobacteria bacterium]
MTTIYHNPRCSKSRLTLELLHNNDIEPTVVEYLKTPLSQTEINTLIDQLDIDAIQLVRVKEAEFKEAGLTKSSTREAIVEAIANYPKLLERPVVVHNNRAAIGRPPENVLELFK